MSNWDQLPLEKQRVANLLGSDTVGNKLGLTDRKRRTATVGYEQRAAGNIDRLKHTEPCI